MKNTFNGKHYNNPVQRLKDTAKMEGSYMEKLLADSKHGRQVTIYDIIKAKRLDNHQDNIKPRVGDMVVFQYDALEDRNLPYWDKFPLIFIVEVKQGHFHGINLHYLPPIWRIKLLAGLKTLNNNNNYDENTRLRISYQMLKRTTLLKAFKPCFKEYSFKGLRSKFIKIHSSEWDIASVLPIAKFKKTTPQKVWNESLREIRKDKRKENDENNQNNINTP